MPCPRLLRVISHARNYELRITVLPPELGRVPCVRLESFKERDDGELHPQSRVNVRRRDLDSVIAALQEAREVMPRPTPGGRRRRALL